MKIAFIGFGGVGQALVKIISERKEKLKQETGMEPEVVAVADMMKGSVYNPEGLDERLLLETVARHNHLDYYPDSPATVKGWDNFQTIKESNADVIVEVTFTDVKTGQPAIDHCRAAFESGKSVVTTNKGPVAVAYRELVELAEKNGVFWGFEGTVMSGTPALRLPFTTLAGNHIREIKGILNGTTNYILTEMEKGLTYNEALQEAQQKGYAEADPVNDVEGYDARYKAVILANVVMGASITAADVACEGITDFSAEALQSAIKNGRRWRLIATIRQEGDRIEAKVGPEQLKEDDPLASVQGATNAIMYECDLAGPIMLTGAGAGLTETGYSLLIDLIHCWKSQA